MDKMQEEFKAWAKVNGLRLERQTSMCGGDMGRYDFGPTQAALEVWCDAWKASRSALRVKLPTFENGSIRGYSGDCEEARMVVDCVAESLEKAGVSYE